MNDWQRRALQTGAGIAALALLWFVGPLLLRHVQFFEVRRVEFVGVEAINPADLAEALKIPANGNLFDDLSPYQKRALAFPGTRSAEVRRRLPGTLVVEVTEAQAVALAPKDGRLTMVGRNGKYLPFDPAVSAPDLPVVEKPNATVARVLGRVQEIDPELFSRVVAASQVKGDVLLDLGGRRLWLRPDVTAEVIRAVMAAEQVLGQQGRAWVELDGRFAGQVVVRGRGRPA
jgi:cell division septal protein FtsQ